MAKEPTTSPPPIQAEQRQRKVYVVSYDLNRPGQEYEELHEMLRENLNGHPILESVWIVRTTLSPDSILHLIKIVSDPNDGFVMLPIREREARAAARAAKRLGEYRKE